MNEHLDPKAYQNGQPVTTDVHGEPTTIPQPKVIAATIGAGVGSAISEIGVWLIETSADIDIPGNIELAIGVVIVAGIAFISGYLKRPSATIN